MKVHLECFPCTLRQIVEASKLATTDENLQARAVEEGIKLLQKFFDKRDDINPAILGTYAHRLVKEITNNPDPYKELKREFNEKASLL